MTCTCATGPWENCLACRDAVCASKGILVSSLEWRAVLGEAEARQILQYA